MGRARWLWLAAPLLMAAWPDIYPSRRIAVSALRYNLISPELEYDALEIEKRYKDACGQGFSLACPWERWQVDGRGDLNRAGEVLSRSCSWEPLACTVRAWSLSRLDGAISPGGSDPERAVSLLRKACKDDLFAPACTSLGELHLEGVGTPQDLNMGYELIREGCEADDWFGCYQLGRLYKLGIGVDADVVRATALFATACENAIPQSCTSYADALMVGEGTDKDVTRAAELYAESCSDRHTRSCATLAGMYELGVGVDVSPYAAIGLYQTACRSDDLNSCYNLATLYAEGRGIEVDADEALDLLIDACDAGHPRSCAHMGQLYVDGDIVDRDMETGLELLEQGCSAGDQEGCVSLGALYEVGDGVPQDMRRAIGIYDHACRNDIGGGCSSLARLEESGAGGEPDLTEAVRLYSKACNLRDATGCGELADRYRTGVGVDRDFREAVTLMAKACEYGHGLSCGRLADATERGSYGLERNPEQAQQLYDRACRMGDGLGCMGHANYLTDATEILEAYEVACDAGIEEGCAAALPMQLDAKFSQLLGSSLNPTCEVWGIDDEDIDRTRLLASYNGPELVLHAGEHAGKTVTIEPDSSELIRRRKRITGISRWGMRLVWEQLDIKIELQEYVDPKAPITAFPAEQSYSADSRGRTALVFSREDNTVQRPVVDRCTLTENYLVLNAEGCSMTQALIAGQLLSECQ